MLCFDTYAKLCSWKGLSGPPRCHCCATQLLQIGKQLTETALQEAYNELLARLKALDGAAIAAAHYQAEQEDVAAALSAFLGALDGVVAAASAASPVAS